MLAWLLGLLLVLVAAALLTFFQEAGLIGAMVGLNRWFGDRLGPTEYEDVDVDHLDQQGFIKIAVKTLPLIFAPTFFLLAVLYTLRFNWILRLATWPTFLMFLLHAGIVFGGLHLFYKLDPRKTALLTLAVLLVYLLVYNLLVPSSLLG